MSAAAVTGGVQAGSYFALLQSTAMTGLVSVKAALLGSAIGSGTAATTATTWSLFHHWRKVKKPQDEGTLGYHFLTAGITVGKCKRHV